MKLCSTIEIKKKMSYTLHMLHVLCIKQRTRQAVNNIIRSTQPLPREREREREREESWYCPPTYFSACNPSQNLSELRDNELLPLNGRAGKTQIFILD